MAGYKVEICGVNTSSLPLLSSKEKSLLLQKIKAGDNIAREKFIKCNLRLVLSIVQRFSQSNENIDDLFQIGCIGMIKALDNFDIKQGVQFSTYAVPMITGEIKRHLRDNSSSIRVSRSLKDTAYKALYAKENYIKKHQKEPTVSEISAETGISREDIVMAMDAVQSPVSLYEPVFSESGDTLYIMDQVSDKKNTDEMWTEKLAILQIMKKLTEKERDIIRRRFFNGKTQMEVADEIGISQAQVSRLEKSAINHIKRLYN